MNKRQYKNNRSYKTGYDDGRFDGVKEGIRHMKKEVVGLEKENGELQADIVEMKKGVDLHKKRIVGLEKENGELQADIVEMKKGVDLHKKRIMDLSERVDNIDKEVQELSDEFNENCETIKGLMIENDELSERNYNLSNDLIFLRDNPAMSDELREDIACLRKSRVNERIDNNKTINSNQRQFSKLQKKNVGINSKIDVAKIKGYDAAMELYDELRAV